MNLPNALTLARILLIPVFVVVFFLPAEGARAAAALLFGAAACTDWLDGYLARRLNQTSRFGAFLDPVADKLMVCTVLVLLVQADPRVHLAVPALVIIGRELAVSALREFMAEIGQRTTVAVATLGKVKTIAQMVALVLMLYRDPVVGIPVYQSGLALLYLAVVLTLWSMLIYLRAAWPLLAPFATSLDTPKAPTRIQNAPNRGE